MKAIYTSMILPYRPIEVSLGLFGLVLLAVCPLVYAFGKCCFYWRPPKEQKNDETTYYSVAGDDVTFSGGDEVMPLFPVAEPQFQPVLASLLPKQMKQADEAELKDEES